MTAGAGRPVSFDTDAEVVDAVFLAQSQIFVTLGHVNRVTFPLKVSGVHHLVGRFRVTIQTSLGNFRPCFIGAAPATRSIGCLPVHKYFSESKLNRSYAVDVTA